MKRFGFVILFIIFFWTEGVSQTNTNVGTEFWVAFPPNQGISAVIHLYISSEVATSGTISSAYPGVNQSFSVFPGIVTLLPLPSGVVLSGGTEDKGIHIVANDPIAVYGLNNQTATTDAFLALPVNSLGLDYRIMTYQTAFPNNGSCLSVVATQDGTTLTIFNHQTSGTATINLNAGQTYHLEAPGANEDLTGSRVQSNYPVAVYGSVDLAKVPVNCSYGDHIVEEMFPCNSWGKNFVTVPLAGRDATGDIFRIVAADNGTDILINGTLVTTINAGDHYDTLMTGYNAISTSKATLLAQFAKGETCAGGLLGDPFMMLILPREQYLKNYTIISVAGVTPFNSHWVNLVAPDYAINSIYEDGLLIPGSAFVQIGTTNYYGAQRSVGAGGHTFNSTFPFGVSVYGWRTVDSYGYPGGGSMSPVGTIDSISLSPDTLYGELNVTNICLTAHVTDTYNNPVVGVLVNFYVSGINPIVGSNYTDASGDAQYCYTQTGIASGVDHIYAESFGILSDTSVVYWTYYCDDPTSGGTIAADQSGCGSYTPALLSGTILPTGYQGTLEYKWQQSTVSGSSGFTDIAGSNSPDYVPGSISQTTWYRRLARVSCTGHWNTAASSNVLQMTFIPQLPVSVSISATASTVCAGTPVTFTATPVNGGTTPACQWKVNGLNAGANSTVFSYTPLNNDIVTCTLTSSESCTSGNPASSSPIVMVVNSILSVAVSVSLSANNVCAGTSVTFTATPSNGGTSPTYQWKVNGGNAGTNSPVYTYVPINGDVVSCILTSSEPCTSGNPASSSPIVMVVNSILPVGVSVSPSANNVCAGTSVTFTATPSNGGTSPTYQWKVNGGNAGANSPVYTYAPANGDLISCTLTSSEPCTSGNPASGNQLSMVVNSILAVGVSVSPSANNVCAGTSVTFTAAPSNGGTSPTYQWKVNGSNAGTSSPVYTYIPVNGDVVTCILTSSAPCTSGNPATSSPVTMTVLPVLPAGISISAGQNPFCPGNSVTFTATPANGGASPSYQWKVNGINAGTNSSSFTFSPLDNDSVRCVLTSNLACVTNNPVSSSKIILNGTLAPPVSFTSCFDSITTLNAKTIKLKGGVPLGGIYSGAGVNSATGVFTPSSAGTGTKTITYTYTNVALCSAGKTRTITVQSNPAFTCGNNLTDIRDNKVYPTVQIGTQCWFAANLNYGTEIFFTQNQRDNCIAEKYNNPASAYQWDELMRYDDTPGLQGLCPPGWHVPTEAEWNLLFANWTNNGFAGSPLKYSGFSGFNAILSGAGHLNVQWDFQNFAAFFWSSTSHGSSKAWAHGLNDYDPSVSLYPSSRSNAFSVRCLKD
ncbi:MAG: hypothetical protein NTU98_06575 [Bacteroidetes bacterium]|nr:hypothetical protein [Bacteroidota bacterium]